MWQLHAPSTPEVATQAPEHGSDEQSDALCEDEERSFEPGKLERDRVDDQASYALQDHS